MTGPIAIDIETVPTLAALSTPYPEADRRPPANYRSEDAIASWRDTDRAAWMAGRVKECSLNPRIGRIVSIATADGRATTCTMAKTEEEEPALLRAWWRMAHDARGRIVTWNGSFDLRFLIVRSLVHRIEPSLPPSIVRDWFKRYTTRPHFDCKAVLTNWDQPRAGEGLTEWAQCFGLGEKMPGTSGAEVWPMVQGQQWLELAAYNQQDAELTWRVYERIAPMFDGSSAEWTT